MTRIRRIAECAALLCLLWVCDPAPLCHGLPAPCLDRIGPRDSLVVADSTGRMLFSKNEAHMRVPASTLKLLTALAAGYAGWQHQSTRTFRVALVGPMTGPQAEFGQEMERGARLYLNQMRQRQGSRVRVELAIFDDLNEPDLARDIARFL